MGSKLGSAHAQHSWTQRSKEKTNGEHGAFEATLCSSGLCWGPTKPCYPEETVLSSEKYCAENSPAYSTDASDKAQAKTADN